MDYFEKNRYPIIGGIVGSLIAVCIFTIGFWKMILVLFLIGLGIYIGLFLKKSGIIDQFIDRK
ncbi:DUF2273 domain-containing protein [Lactococcus lactis]|uniref:DUF2273 domain-containing protein n=1 Tax=Lactococcus lactis TaxID=1358 RepID=UPI001D1949D8|nr:DUF2273 domain-containing protein [Lactococcus lactis]MCC4122049.1 DUF2273 domain-containing protein [Lactococcus lactis]